MQGEKMKFSKQQPSNSWVWKDILQARHLPIGQGKWRVGTRIQIPLLQLVWFQVKSGYSHTLAIWSYRLLWSILLSDTCTWNEDLRHIRDQNTANEISSINISEFGWRTEIIQCTCYIIITASHMNLRPTFIGERERSNTPVYYIMAPS